MNCTAWNSVVAKALSSRPVVQPSTASATATTSSIQTGPATSRPHTQMAKPVATVACTTARDANATA